MSRRCGEQFLTLDLALEGSFHLRISSLAMEIIIRGTIQLLSHVNEPLVDEYGNEHMKRKGDNPMA